MGMDIYTGQGVFADIEEILKIINSKNKEKIIETCHSFHECQVDLLKDANDCSELIKFFKPLSEIKPKASIKVIKETIKKVVQVSEGEYGDSWVKYEETVLDLINQLIAVADIDLPQLIELKVFTSQRINGCDVPIGEPVFIFNDQQCFKKQYTKKGTNMKKLVGFVEEKIYTELSY
jgi:L-cysteine desulfidase